MALSLIIPEKIAQEVPMKTAVANLFFSISTSAYRVPFHITNSVRSSSSMIDVRLELENGVVGLGQASPSFRVNGEQIRALMGYREDILDAIRGMDVLAYRRLFDVLDGYSRSAPSLKAAVQYAVLDAMSQHLGVPVSTLLGGKKEYVETDLTIGIDTLENTVSRSREAFEAGFDVLKLKVGEDLASDIQRVLAVYEAVPQARFIVDANLGFTPKQAIAFGQEMARNNVPIAVFEQPVGVEDVEGIRLVRRNCVYPVGADEMVKTRFDALRLIRRDAVDFINIKLMKAGISDALAIVEMARSAHVSLMIGCMSETGMGIAQGVHFASGTGAFAYHDLDTIFLAKEYTPLRFRVEKNRLYPTM